MVQNDWSPHFFLHKKRLTAQMVPIARLGMIPRYPNVTNEVKCVVGPSMHWPRVWTMLASPNGTPKLHAIACTRNIQKRWKALSEPKNWTRAKRLFTPVELRLLRQAASTMRQMLAALKCCHDHYMGHFDVKPEILSIRRHSWVRIIPSWWGSLQKSALCPWLLLFVAVVNG